MNDTGGTFVSDTGGTFGVILSLIDEIRMIDDVHCKIIPIYCYSRHGNNKNIRTKAFTKGATNIFSKEDINYPDSDEILFLKNSLSALAFIYASAIGKAFYIEDVNNQLNEVNRKLNEILNIDKVCLQAIIKLSSYQNIVDLEEINEQNKPIIISIIGEDYFNNLKQYKWQIQDSNHQKSLIDNITNLVDIVNGFFPLLSPFISTLKIIKLFMNSQF